MRPADPDSGCRSSVCQVVSRRIDAYGQEPFELTGALGYVHPRSSSAYVQRRAGDRARREKTVVSHLLPSFGITSQAAWTRPRARNLTRGRPDESWRAFSQNRARPVDPHPRPPTLWRLVAARKSWQFPGTTLGFNTRHLYQVFGKTCCSHLGVHSALTVYAGA